MYTADARKEKKRALKKGLDSQNIKFIGAMLWTNNSTHIIIIIDACMSC